MIKQEKLVYKTFFYKIYGGDDDDNVKITLVKEVDGNCR